MCLYVTMLLPKAADLAAAAEALSAHGRDLALVASAPKAAEADHYFLARGAACECGTWLGAEDRQAGEAEGWAKRHEDRRRAMKRKGWSDAKIARAMTDIVSAYEERTARRGVLGKDAEIGQWANMIRSLLAVPGASHVGVLLHQYSGAIEGEDIAATREVCVTDKLEDILPTIREDVIYEFRPSRPVRGKEKAG